MGELPKIFHFVWIGDEALEPVEAVESWRKRHPDWEIRVYRNADALSDRWRFSKEIAEFHRRGRFPGAADLIRWEALFEHGGVATDADSICLAPLPDWLLDCELAACWDNTPPEGDLLSNGFVLARPNHPVIGALLDEIGSKPMRYERWSWSKMKTVRLSEWRTTGPKPFTNVVKRMKPVNFTPLPSHFFLPQRRDGQRYSGGGPVYAEQLWSTSRRRGAETREDALKRLSEIGR